MNHEGRSPDFFVEKIENLERLLQKILSNKFLNYQS